MHTLYHIVRLYIPKGVDCTCKMYILMYAYLSEQSFVTVNELLCVVKNSYLYLSSWNPVDVTIAVAYIWQYRSITNVLTLAQVFDKLPAHQTTRTFLVLRLSFLCET